MPTNIQILRMRSSLTPYSVTVDNLILRNDLVKWQAELFVLFATYCSGLLGPEVTSFRTLSPTWAFRDACARCPLGPLHRAVLQKERAYCDLYLRPPIKIHNGVMMRDELSCFGTLS